VFPPDNVRIAPPPFVNPADPPSGAEIVTFAVAVTNGPLSVKPAPPTLYPAELNVRLLAETPAPSVIEPIPLAPKTASSPFVHVVGEVQFALLPSQTKSAAPFVQRFVAADATDAPASKENVDRNFEDSLAFMGLGGCETRPSYCHRSMHPHHVRHPDNPKTFQNHAKIPPSFLNRMTTRPQPSIFPPCTTKLSH
jgi:hypothetical protein